MALKNWNDCTPAERIERFERAVLVMQQMKPHVREKHFDMMRWAQRTKCGTVACAAGHCAMDPWFRARGLTIKALDNDSAANRFFGDTAAEKIFMSDDLFEQTGARGHRKVLKRMTEYLTYLKLERAVGAWT